ncbi:sensor histidine kinase [Sphaerisporangium dianthi]|uniref:histidine kinase n=1 Tax=Sphaerisporangium dianthi TaxID=1436120 RepID=A0ABV9CTX1_9ACTN
MHLLLGGVLLLPYLLVAGLMAQNFAVAGVPRGVPAFVLALTVVVGVVPPFLRGTRALEIVAARSLLGVDLPDPPETAEQGRAAWETRSRAALWFAVHLAVGGLVGALILVPLVSGVIFVARWAGMAGGPLNLPWLAPLDQPGTGLLLLVGVAMLVGVVYAVAGLGALAAVMAPVLLGPSAAERIAALEERAAKLAERNRLARELHDSIGHALTVTMLQASAALHLLDTDPAFARQALIAIEETGRAATEDLDRVLGMLREPEPSSWPRMADLDGLLAQSRGIGVQVGTRFEGSLADLPEPVSREGYRIVQECLTNVLRHAGPVPVALNVAADGRTLAIEVANPVTGRRSRETGGRGLAGIRERVTLLGGTMTAGRESGHWRVSVRLPAVAGRKAGRRPVSAEGQGTGRRPVGGNPGRSGAGEAGAVSEEGSGA